METNTTLKTIEKILKRADKVEQQGNYSLGREYRAAAIELQRRLINLNKGGRYASL